MKEDLPQDQVKLIKEQDFGIVKHEIELDYDYWTAGEKGSIAKKKKKKKKAMPNLFTIEQILHAVMPEGSTDIPASFTQIGHIGKKNSISL
jgi:hypothetical protein